MTTIPVRSRFSTIGVLVLPVAAVVLACAPAENGPPITRARGNEPFWAVTFEGEGATFRTPDLPDGINYRDGRWKRKGTAAEWTFKARRERAEGLWLELQVTEAPCTDSMSGEAFPYKATVTFEDKHMEGCAS
jgi:uncharacterized membrane protein